MSSIISLPKSQILKHNFFSNLARITGSHHAFKFHHFSTSSSSSPDIPLPEPETPISPDDPDPLPTQNPQPDKINNLGPRTPRGIFGNLGTKLGFAQENPLLASSKFSKSIHSVGPKEFERGVDNRPVDTEKDSGYFRGSNQRVDEIDRRRLPFEPARNIGIYESLTRRFADFDRLRGPNETGRDVRPLGRGFGPSESSRNINMNGIGGIMRENENYRSGVEQNADIVHVKIMRNNTFVTVTDSKGNKKLGASAGALAEMKGGPKVSKYSAEATAEHIGREAKRMGLKSVVLKVNGFTFFKKKKLAILSFRDGYTNSRSGERNPIVYLEDTTRKPHNGCRRKKQRRV